MNNESTPGLGDDPTADERLHEEGSRERNDSGRGFDRTQAEREARNAIGNARDELQALLENQKNAAAGQVELIAQALRSTGDELRKKDQHTVATYVAHVADRIEYWSGRLRERHIDRLGRDMRQLANRQPGLFIAGAVVIGFAATRFLKSTDIDHNESPGTRDTTTAGTQATHKPHASAATVANPYNP